MVHIESKSKNFGTKNTIIYLLLNFFKNWFVTSKILKDEKIWRVNGFPIHIKLYDSEIIITDEDGNKLKITKTNPMSIILNLIGSFKTK